jgi:hypothetical protein
MAYATQPHHPSHLNESGKERDRQIDRHEMAKELVGAVELPAEKADGERVEAPPSFRQSKYFTPWVDRTRIKRVLKANKEEIDSVHVNSNRPCIHRMAPIQRTQRRT